MISTLLILLIDELYSKSHATSSFIFHPDLGEPWAFLSVSYASPLQYQAFGGLVYFSILGNCSYMLLNGPCHGKPLCLAYEIYAHAQLQFSHFLMLSLQNY